MSSTNTPTRLDVKHFRWNLDDVTFDVNTGNTGETFVAKPDGNTLELTIESAEAGLGFYAMEFFHADDQGSISDSVQFFLDVSKFYRCELNDENRLKMEFFVTTRSTRCLWRVNIDDSQSIDGASKIVFTAESLPKDNQEPFQVVGRSGSGSGGGGFER